MNELMYPWHLIIHTDGGVTNNRAVDPGPAFAAFVIHNTEGTYLGSQSMPLVGTNNEAEYAAVSSALMFLATNPLYLSAEIHCDSKLVVEQIGGGYKVKNPRIKHYHSIVMEQLKAAPIPVTLKLIPRSQNKQADWLCNHAKVFGPKTEFATPIPTRLRRSHAGS